MDCLSEGFKMKSPLSHGLRNRILEIEHRIVGYEEQKSRLSSLVTGLKEQFFNKEISFEEYSAIIEETFREQSYEGALNQYNTLIEKSYDELRRIRHADAPKQKNNFMLYSAIALILILFSIGLFKYGTNPTGFAVFTTQQGTEDILNMEFNQTQPFIWNIKNPQPINSVLISGTLYGKGAAKMYLLAEGKKYLVFEANNSEDAKIITDACYESCMMQLQNQTKYEFLIELFGSRFTLQSIKYAHVRTFDMDVFPQRNIIIFKPNFTESYTFDILNNERQDFDALVYTEGNISSYITLSDSLIHFTPDKDKQRINYEISLPNILEPGTYTGNVAIRYIPAGKFTGETPVTRHTIELRVPSEGSAASASFEINELSDSEIKFIVPVLNTGDTQFSAKAEIEISDDLKKIITLETNKAILSKNEQADLTSLWDAIAEGVYHARATVFYSNKTITLEKEFLVRKPSVQITNIAISASQLNNDEVNLNVWVKNELHENLQDVYFDVLSYDKYQNQVKKHISDVHDILQNEQAMLSTPVNIKEYIPGDYNLEIAVHYRNGSLERRIPVRITKDSFIIPGGEEKSGINVNYYLAALITLLIIINSIWLVYFLKRR
jgi:hypothetical protein